MVWHYHHIYERTFLPMDDIKRMKYLTQYKAQIAAARQRQLEWHLTFDEWINFWGDDIDKRGIKRESMVMALHDRELGFRLDNIYKTTKGELTIELVNRGNRHERSVRTPQGEFKSVAAAARAHNYGAMQVIYRIRKKWPDWEYTDKKEG